MITAWYGEPELKSAVLARLEQDRDLDRIVQGTYWKDGRGCHLGCLTRCYSNTQEATERLFGIPLRVAYLLEAIFERLPKEQCEWWVLEGTRAIPVGADLSLVHHELAYWLLGPESPSAAGNAHPLVCEPIAAVRELHLRAAGGETDLDWSAARAAAESAARAAESAARAAWLAAWSAVWSAAWSAELAAWSAELAAWSAELAARAARAARAAAAWKQIAEKTIEIFAACEVRECEQCADSAASSLRHVARLSAVRI